MFAALAPTPAPAPQGPTGDEIPNATVNATDPATTAAGARTVPESEPEPETAEIDRPKPRARAKPAPKDAKIRPRDKKTRRDEEWDRDARPRANSKLMPVLLVCGLGAAALMVLVLGGGAVLYSRHLAAQKAEEAALAERQADLARRANMNPVPQPPFQPVVPELPNFPPNPEPPQPRPPFNPPAEPPFEPLVNPPVVPPVVRPRPDPVPAPAAPKRALVRAAARPMPITPTKAADKTEIKLPGTVDQTCFGGGGRFVILRIPSEKKVAVLDVCEGKVVKYLPLPEDSALVAAGNEHLFILAPTANVIQRWSLTTFEKEVTVANPLAGTPRQLLIGHATDGPLFVVGPNRMLDPKTFKELDVGAGGQGRGMGAMGGHPSYPPSVRISADGRVLAWWTQGLSPSGLSSMVLSDTGAKSFSEHTTVGAILPGPDGTLFTGGGLFTPELKPIGDKSGYQYWHHVPVPAAHGKLYLSIAPDNSFGADRTPPKVSLKLAGENKALADLGGLAGLDVPRDNNQTMARGLQLHDRVFLVPDAKAAAVLHATGNKVTIHAFDVEAMLAKAGVDYLFVVSRPPGATCGEKFSYKPEVKSRKGGVKIKLDAGPDGMTIAADGTVTWDVPKGFDEPSAPVILTVSDSTGQETFHTFILPVARP